MYMYIADHQVYRGQEKVQSVTLNFYVCHVAQDWEKNMYGLLIMYFRGRYR